jgi:hypothetical protein
MTRGTLAPDKEMNRNIFHTVDRPNYLSTS